MIRVSSIVAVSLALTLAQATHASASDVEEGEQLYVSQCEICHGLVSGKEIGLRERFFVPRRIQLAMLDSDTSNTAHLLSGLISESSTKETQLTSLPTSEHLAVALPNGPPLRGVIGRPAASVEGYKYSKSMLETMKGVVWSAEKLDRWITNSQEWVPGSFMFYKQDDADARRKIISYLKANP
jgi:cytochrome c